VVTFMLGRCPDALQATDLGDHSYFAYLTVDCLDDYHARAISEDTEILKAPTNEPWGRREMALRTAERLPPDALRANPSRSGEIVDVERDSCYSERSITAPRVPTGAQPDGQQNAGRSTTQAPKVRGGVPGGMDPAVVNWADGQQILVPFAPEGVVQVVQVDVGIAADRTDRGLARPSAVFGQPPPSPAARRYPVPHGYGPARRNSVPLLGRGRTVRLRGRWRPATRSHRVRRQWRRSHAGSRRR
jgi:hypothetical protein